MSRLSEAIRVFREDYDVQTQAIGFLQQHPNPDDDTVHAWAKKRNLDPHDVEPVFYRLATRYAQLLADGRAAEKGVTVDDVDPKELAMGVEVEKEHTRDEFLARKISADHLAEISDYYTRLEKMEREAGL